jgi:hypothetical protein
MKLKAALPCFLSASWQATASYVHVPVYSSFQTCQVRRPLLSLQKSRSPRIGLTVLLIQGKAIPLQAWTGRERPQEVEAIGFQDNLHIKVAKLKTPRTGHLYPSTSPGNIPGILIKVCTPNAAQVFFKKKYWNLH